MQAYIHEGSLCSYKHTCKLTEVVSNVKSKIVWSTIFMVYKCNGALCVCVCGGGGGVGGGGGGGVGGGGGGGGGGEECRMWGTVSIYT